MRVGIVCPYSLAVWGGVQTQVLGLARSLRSKGVDTQVLSPCDGQPPEPWVTPLGNSIPYAQNGSFAPVAPDPAAQLRTLGTIWDGQFDVLHLHEPLVPGPTLTSVMVKPTPLIGTFHASGHVASYRWGKPILRRFANRLDLRVAVSPDAAGMASRYLGGTYDILFNGIEVSLFETVPPADKTGPTVLFLGRHEPRKGLAVLLKAAQLLPPEVSIWVAGQGPETEELTSKYAFDKRIEWIGALTEPEKIARLKAADVFCVPSLGGESFGIVLLEGMAANTPVVASDLPAYRVVSREGTDAALFPTGDAQALAKQLLKCLDGGPARDALVQSGADRVQDFSMSRLADAYVSRYQQLLI